MENFIEVITKNAGELILSRFKEKKDLLSLRKGSKEVVTKCDKDVDQLLIKSISNEYPDHGILTEESGFNDKESDYLWIVDSLDGSGNFASGNPLFSVCVALSYKEELFLATTYAPFIGEFYFAKKGKGAFLNGEKISVSDVKETRGSYIAFCDGHEKDREKLSERLSVVFKNAIDLRKIGSAGVETGWLASGRIDGFLMFEGDPWDLASGVLIAKEAGGTVTDFRGNPWTCNRGSFVFSNGKIHQELLKMVS